MDSPVDVMMKEYELLRAEILAALGHRLQVWSFGSAAVGVLLAGALTAFSQGDKVFSPFVMAVVVPTLSLAILHTWISEVMRGRRASWYLATLERRINQALGFGGLSWEQALRTSDDRRMKFRREHYYMTKLFFLGTGVVSSGIGAQILFSDALSLAKAICPPSSNPWLLAGVWMIVWLVVYTSWHRLVVPNFGIWDKIDDPAQAQDAIH